MADAVRKVAPNEKPIVLGNGYGGFVALQMALRHPGIASRLVFADCGARFSEPGREAFRNMARGAAAKGLEAIADVAMRRLFAPDFQAAHPELIAERRAAFLATNLEVFQSACNDLAGLDVLGELHDVHTPALVMVGEQDEATPPEMSVALAKGLPNAEACRSCRAARARAAIAGPGEVSRGAAAVHRRRTQDRAWTITW